MDSENLENFDPEDNSLDTQTALQRRRNRFKKLAERTHELDNEFEMWSKETASNSKPEENNDEQLIILSKNKDSEQKSVDSTKSSKSSSRSSNRATNRLSSEQLKLKYSVETKSSEKAKTPNKPLTPVNREIPIQPKIQQHFIPTSNTAPNLSKYNKKSPVQTRSLKPALKSPQKQSEFNENQPMTRSVSVRDRISALKSSGLNVTFRKEKPADILKKLKKGSNHKSNPFNEESTPVITEETENSEKTENSENYKSDDDDGFKTCRDEAEFTQLGSLGGNSPAFLCGNSFFNAKTPKEQQQNSDTPKLDAVREEFENMNNLEENNTPKRRHTKSIVNDVDEAFKFLPDKSSIEIGVSKTQSDGEKGIEEHLISTIQDRSLTDPHFNPADLSTDQSELTEPVIDMNTAHGKRLAAWYYDDHAKFDSIGNTPKKVKADQKEESNRGEQEAEEKLKKDDIFIKNTDPETTAKSQKRKHVSHDEDEEEKHSLDVLANTPTANLVLYSQSPDPDVKKEKLKIFSPVISAMDTTTVVQNRGAHAHANATSKTRVFACVRVCVPFLKTCVSCVF